MSQVSEQRRDQIVQTARRIVDEQGPARLTAETITKEIGVSRPLLYHYFDNVDNLLDTVVDIYAQEFEDALAAWEAAQDSGATRGELASSLAALARDRLFDGCPLCRDPGDPKGAASHNALIDRCASMMARHARASAAGPLSWCLDSGDPELAFGFALNGMAGALRLRPDLGAESLAWLFGRAWRSPEAAPAPAAEAPEPPLPGRPEAAQAPAEPAPAPQGDAPSPADDDDAAGRRGREGAKRGLFGRLFNQNRP